MIQTLLELDGNILLWIQDNLRNEFLTSFFKVYTSLGNAGIVWIVLSIFFLIFKKTRRLGILCIMGILGSAVLNNLILKPLVARTRPYDEVAGLIRLIGRQVDFSFPSGHTGCAFAVSLIVLKEGNRKIPGILLVVSSALLGFSRMYLGVHYLSDVLGGVLSGVVVSLVCCLVYQKNEKWIEAKLKRF